MAESIRVVNLEAGKPYAEAAIARMDTELDRAWRDGCDIVKLIHGYGSSGAGGRLREAIREALLRERERGEIADFIPGEEFSIFSAAARSAMERCPALRRDHDLENHNHGITLVLLD